MRTLTRAGGLICLSLLLTACPRPVRPPPPAPTVPPAPTAPAPSADMRGATVYQIDPQESEVSILVFRGGKFSRLGHNHVVTSHNVTGRAWVNPEFARSGFELSFPVAQLAVDEPQARRAAGSDFPPDIPQSDKDGTRNNMLRAEVLDAEHYPEVRLRSTRVGGTLAAPQVTAHITIKDASRDVEVPLKLAVEGQRLNATGEFDIAQTQFGMKPFSVALGALEVQDRLHIKFRMTAVRQQ